MKKIICNYIDDYLSYYEETKDTDFNIERIQLIENIIKPLLERDDVYLDEKQINNCIRFCESNFYPLFPYQKFLYSCFFIYNNDGTPHFDELFILMGRGNGKDGCVMPLAAFLITPLHGIKGYNVDIVANAEDQAKDTFNVVYNMLDDNKQKFKGKFSWTKELIENKATRSKLKYNTSNAKTKDGKSGGLVIFNEMHTYETVDQINVFTSKEGKVENERTITITTNGYVRDGPLDDKIRVAKEILKTGENSINMLPFLCNIDDLEEVDKPEAWIKANPSIEFRPVLKKAIMKAYKRMQLYPSERAEFITKRMNLPERNDEVTVAKWNDILKTSYKDIELRILRDTPDLTNRRCVIGIDYADIRDFASAGILFKIDGEYIWRQKTWICANSPFFNSIKFANNFKETGDEFQDYEILTSETLSVEMVVEWCYEQTRNYMVEKIVMDTYRYTLFRESFERYGITPENKSNPYGLLRMIRRQASINAMVAPLIETSIANGNVNFGPSAIMRWYTNNTSVHIDKFGNKTYGKIEPKLRKNDGFMAFVVAMSAESLLDEIVVYV